MKNQKKVKEINENPEKDKEYIEILGGFYRF